MGPILQGLIRLQTVESRLRAVKAKLARSRRSVILQENQVRTLQNGLDAKKEELQLMRIQASRLELELKSGDDQIAKLRAVLNIAKTNKEYATVLTQLNTNKADNSKVESQILDMMKNIEADEAECVNIGSQIDAERQKLDTVRRQSEISAEKYEKEITEIQADWDEIAETISAVPLELFRRVAETYDGEALAIVKRRDGKTEAYSCGGCFMGLPTETANMLMTKDEVIRCPNCTRILVLDTSES